MNQTRTGQESEPGDASPTLHPQFRTTPAPFRRFADARSGAFGSTRITGYRALTELRPRHDVNVTLDDIVKNIRQRPGPVRLVAVDGPGGSGKSTFAAQLSAATDGAPIAHTDDFASADNPINWWPRLLQLVIEPLADGRPAIYQRYDWPTESLAEWHTVDPAPIIIIEGVSAARREWSQHLSYVIWIETSRELRLQRAVERDGEDALDDWEYWMAEEDGHYERDPTRERSDAIIDGASGRAIEVR
ncbi:MAG: hypothetical protein GY701_32870 [Sulfitobacter sp.]|nr:hypothetical protein [Sulfitobacter sp.]